MFSLFKRHLGVKRFLLNLCKRLIGLLERRIRLFLLRHEFFVTHFQFGFLIGRSTALFTPGINGGGQCRIFDLQHVQLVAACIGRAARFGSLRLGHFQGTLLSHQFFVNRIELIALACGLFRKRANFGRSRHDACTFALLSPEADRNRVNNMALWRDKTLATGKFRASSHRLIERIGDINAGKPFLERPFYLRVVRGDFFGKRFGKLRQRCLLSLGFTVKHEARGRRIVFKTGRSFENAHVERPCFGT